MIGTCNGLPASIRATLTRVAEEWLASPDRPRPTDAVARHWDTLIDEWVRGPKYPLLVRKNGDRGCEQRHAPSGRVVICADNSPAHWALAAAISGEKPTSTELLAALESGAWPVAFAISAAGAGKQPRYRGLMSRSIIGKALNIRGWKVCHIQTVAEGSRGSRLDDLPLDVLIEHSRRFLSPSNMFVVPTSHAGFGELPEVREVFARSTAAPLDEHKVVDPLPRADDISPARLARKSGKKRWRAVPPPGAATSLAYVLKLARGPDPGKRPVISRERDRTFVHYSRPRVWFDRDAWEALTASDDVLVQRVCYPGTLAYTIALTRSELEQVFGEVRDSASWSDVRCYHFPAAPPAVESFRVQT